MPKSERNKRDAQEEEEKELEEEKKRNLERKVQETKVLVAKAI